MFISFLRERLTLSHLYDYTFARSIFYPRLFRASSRSNHFVVCKMSDPLFSIEYATTGRSSCKKCKTKVDKGVLRIARMTANPFSEGEMMKAWYHAPCLFDALKRARAATRKVEGTDDLEGFDVISEDDKEDVRRMIEG